jgi:UDP-N-acetylmuramoyl-tripeptide--D-alanyl-D-alanine ligase
MPIVYLTLVVALAFTYKRTLTYLHIFQQDEYDSGRFLRWVGSHWAIDRKISCVIAAFAVLQLSRVISVNQAQLVVGLTFLVGFFFERDPRRQAKKALILTERARRVFIVSLIFSAALSLVALVLRSSQVVFWLLPLQFIPIALVISTAVLSGSENNVQRRYWTEAHEKLLSLHPIVIGITGSFGKTSVKHILGHILETQAPTLITPGSVNTPMGITRIIREKLTRQHKYFVCEMGAYGPGSISRICELAPPEVAILVSIGKAHYERFKNLDTVARTKLELAEATAAGKAKIIISQDFLEFGAPAEFVKSHTDQCITLGSSAGAGMRIISTALTSEGVEAKVVWREEEFTLKAPLFGEHHATNIAFAFAAACALGISPDDCIVALATTPQVKHRLEVRDDPSGAVVIDDAYNSNPTGFANALVLLDRLRRSGGRRLLVTPGMVELGTAHDEEHRKLGEMADKYCDIFLAVKQERIKSMLHAFAESGSGKKLLSFDSFSDAQAWLQKNLKPEDVVLLENDLPDIYERKLRL